MLIFAKLLLKLFVNDMINVFCFPDKTIREIYNRYQIQKCFLYQNLTDTNSTSLFVNFICNVDQFISEQIKIDVSHDNFYFKISELKSKTNKEKTFNASKELRLLSKNDTKRSRSRTKTSFGAGSRPSGLSADRKSRLSDFDRASAGVSS